MAGKKWTTEQAKTGEPEPLWLSLRRQTPSETLDRSLFDYSTELAGHLLRATAQTEPPYDALSVASFLGIPVTMTDNPGWSSAARLSESDGWVLVWLDRADDEQVQRFALAHTIGHILLHRRQSEWADARYHQPELSERQATAFALDLLAPKIDVRQYAGLVGHSVDKLAQLFCLTKATFAVRYIELFQRQAVRAMTPKPLAKGRGLADMMPWNWFD